MVAVLALLAPLLILDRVSGKDQNCLLQLVTEPHEPHGGVESCTPLLNQGSFFSVQLCVGTPKQCFDVVADTGSDSVIVPSCICSETPGSGCTLGEKCFRGTNRSATFSISDKFNAVQITFGSGTIEAAVASESVEVGSLHARMEDGVLLMVNRAALRISGMFQGILGLGIPKDEQAMYLLQQTLTASTRHDSMDKSVDPMVKSVICVVFPELCGGVGQSPWDVDPSWQTASIPTYSRHGSDGHRVAHEDAPKKQFESKLFLKNAKVQRFSMCFRDQNLTGALRLNPAPLQEPIKNIGTLHWGMDFQGMSIGQRGEQAPAETIFCGPETQRPGMDTPCGIIPDSGTTQILGPQAQVRALEAGICQRWPRCRAAAKGQPSSEKVFQLLLEDCSGWLTKENGLLELPSLFFHVKDANGRRSAFELTAWAWVTEMGVADQPGRKICTSNFGVMEYQTQKNGPVWIFGTPLFYEYDVGYDLSTKMMALQKGKCEPCPSSAGMSLTHGSTTNPSWPRAAHGKPRVPYLDVNLPL
mmetsp:Transcript_70326/g.139422  ORF Transcript_70326/g.139422 Transcript_70326/m.139422 type:complete len:529 (+) Transcript_70326:69-1655(+)|eukprot:CAMPEP_0172811750 /NCGR_PEP_ID=MMETSP1075-20121228/9609_1 /TAXON_ID=2916 /ORGANISM="Ceratium fusus, Strain PA161109" /LENGTH=528 /DNA_ID=CAMNT_0013651215 /DNA_START=54 /DNA_END=1640 /DNA_ORIENTATION=-